jgi:hypothetical protein
MTAAWESFYRAVNELASAAPLKQRLIAAYSNHLQDVSPDELPAAIRSGFLRISGQLTCVSPLRGESAVCATVRKMSNDEAETAAQRIVQLLADLAVHQEAPVRVKPRGVLSLYAAEG